MGVAAAPARARPGAPGPLPDLRGLGSSDAPRGTYAKETWAADLVALLDALDLDSADIAGHDWGGLAALLAALAAPDRVRSVAAVSILHPWPRTPAPSLRTVVPLGYQLPLALPVGGEQLLRRLPVLVRELIRRGSGPGHRWTDDELDAYAEVLRDPARARASSAIYRTFLLRELGPLARGRYRDRRLAVPALIATGAADPVVAPDLIAGLDRHAGAARAPRSSRAPATSCRRRRPPRSSRCSASTSRPLAPVFATEQPADRVALPDTRRGRLST